MESKNLSRRLGRLEQRLNPSKQEHILMIQSVDRQGRPVNLYRLTSAGLQKVTPDEDAAKPDTHEDGK